LAPLELALYGLVDDLLDVRSAAAAAKAGSGRHRDFTGRSRSLPNEAANLSVADSAAMTNEHRGFPYMLDRRILRRSKLKINVVFI
jgi:hypothetical protein